MPLTLSAPVHSDLLIKKSRFIGCVEPMGSREEAVARVAELRGQHPAAAHVCWALHAGGQSAANDDGEPGGTAGQPMLRVLRHQDLDGVLATVVRYFGGVKLGAGGLVRAYTDAVAQALLGAEKVAIRAVSTLACEIPYALEGAFRREIASAGAALLKSSHAENVVLSFSVVQDELEALRLRLDELAQGQVTWLAEP